MNDQHLIVRAQGITDRGRVRNSNQDAFLIDNQEGLYVVADGMGGHAGGEIASGLCISSIKEYFKNQAVSDEREGALVRPKMSLLNTLTGAINFSSTRIYEKALEQPLLKGMGTTATAVKIEDSFLYIGHVGDSRLYLIRCGYIYQLTNDHSLVSEQVRAGIITKEEAEKHHLKNVITRSVGFQEEEDVDTSVLPLIEGDVLLLCSDGLHGKLSDSEIAKICLEDVSTAATRLVAESNIRGGEDNITAIVLEVSRKS